MSSAASALVRATGLRRGRHCNLDGGSLRGTATARRPCLPKPWFPILTGRLVETPHLTAESGSNAQDNGSLGARWHPNAVPPFCDQAAKISEKTFQ